jgi:hypothetical protein
MRCPVSLTTTSTCELMRRSCTWMRPPFPVNFTGHDRRYGRRSQSSRGTEEVEPISIWQVKICNEKRQWLALHKRQPIVAGTSRDHAVSRASKQSFASCDEVGLIIEDQNRRHLSSLKSRMISKAVRFPHQLPCKQFATFHANDFHAFPRARDSDGT